MRLCSFPALTLRRIWTNDWVIGLEKPALVSSPFYFMHFMPFQVCKYIGWIGHGLTSPTKTVRWRTTQQTAMLAVWTIEKLVSWVFQTVFTEVPNLLRLHIWVQSLNSFTLTGLALVVFLKLQTSERYKLWSLLICFKIIVKRKQHWKTWWHYSNKIRSQDCLAFLFPIEKMSAALMSETPGDQKN